MILDKLEEWGVDPVSQLLLARVLLHSNYLLSGIIALEMVFLIFKLELKAMLWLLANETSFTPGHNDMCNQWSLSRPRTDPVGCRTVSFRLMYAVSANLLLEAWTILALGSFGSNFQRNSFRFLFRGRPRLPDYEIDRTLKSEHDIAITISFLLESVLYIQVIICWHKPRPTGPKAESGKTYSHLWVVWVGSIFLDVIP
jgi:hypothetical protein